MTTRSMISVQKFALLNGIARSTAQLLITDGRIVPMPIRIGAGKGIWLIARGAKIIPPMKRKGKR